VNSEAKITNTHRDRLAVIYLRQSSMAQVREHTVSAARQYGLAEEAVRLGWARPDVLVIDTDARSVHSRASDWYQRSSPKSVALPCSSAGGARVGGLGPGAQTAADRQDVNKRPENRRACALIAWYISACAANCIATRADTWSAAAGTTPVVGAAAAAFPAFIAEPTPRSVPADAASASGCMVTNTTCASLARTDRP
jgi:hypothetical protein